MVAFISLQRELTPLKRPRFWFTLAYAMLILLGVFSLIPAPDIGGSDKLMHFFVYFIFSAGFCVLVKGNKQLVLLLIGLTAYGILLEVLQGMTGYRVMDTVDMLANSAGVLVGIFTRFTPLPDWFRNVERSLIRE